MPFFFLLSQLFLTFRLPLMNPVLENRAVDRLLQGNLDVVIGQKGDKKIKKTSQDLSFTPISHTSYPRPIVP
jgi:hypothetical protein